jgi:DNA repair ATPase RecN
MKNEIDYTKDHLVITRDEGKIFRHFRWYSTEKVTEEEIQKLITKWNNEHDDSSCELILNPLIREICAYREHAAPFQSVIDDANEVKKTIEEAEDAVSEIIEKLEWCNSEFCRIRGLEI